MWPFRRKTDALRCGGCRGTGNCSRCKGKGVADEERGLATIIGAECGRCKGTGGVRRLWRIRVGRGQQSEIFLTDPRRSNPT